MRLEQPSLFLRVCARKDTGEEEKKGEGEAGERMKELVEGRSRLATGRGPSDESQLRRHHRQLTTAVLACIFPRCFPYLEPLVSLHVTGRLVSFRSILRH